MEAIFGSASNVMLGCYLCIALVLGLELAYDFLRLRLVPVTPAMHLGGIAMLMDSAAIIGCFFLDHVWPDSHLLGYAVAGFDLLTSECIMLLGYSLAANGSLSSRTYIYITAGCLVAFLALIISGDYLIYSAIYDLVMVMMLVILCVRAARYSKMLQHRYSNTEHRGISWFFVFISWQFLIVPLYQVTCVNASVKMYLAPVVYLVFGLMYIYLARHLFLQAQPHRLGEDPTAEEIAESELYDNMVSDDDSDESETAASLVIPRDLLETMAADITRLMEVDKLYHNPDLCVDDLVKGLHTNSSYFYYFMRDEMQTNFFDFVNGYRIKEAKQMLVAGEKIEAIATECGFNSANSFRRAFKKMVGLTPSEWREDERNRNDK